MGKPLLIMMMGHPGSGKSYFARHLAEREKIVRLNADALRTEMYGSTEEMIRYKALDQTLLSEKMFRALDYVGKQILSFGLSVIFDTNNNKQLTRENYGDMARQFDAIAVTAWIQASPDDALHRVQQREATPDQHKWSEERAHEVIKRHIDNTDEPGEDENVIIIDGTIPFEEQYESFKKQLEEISA